MSTPGTKVYELIEKLNGRQIVKMDFGLKALQLLNAKTEQKIEEAIGLFTDKQKDMMLKVLLGYVHTIDNKRESGIMEPCR